MTDNKFKRNTLQQKRQAAIGFVGAYQELAKRYDELARWWGMYDHWVGLAKGPEKKALRAEMVLLAEELWDKNEGYREERSAHAVCRQAGIASNFASQTHNSWNTRQLVLKGDLKHD